jgi:hypothetical protein
MLSKKFRSLLVGVALVLAAGSALAQTDADTAPPAEPTAIAQSAEVIHLCAHQAKPQLPGSFKAPSGSPPRKLVDYGDCCGPVNGGCVSWCGIPGGCTAKGDCTIHKP